MPAACLQVLPEITYKSILEEKLRYKTLVQEGELYYILSKILEGYIKKNIIKGGYYGERWIQEYHYEICAYLEKLKSQIRGIRNYAISIDSVVESK